MQNVGTNYDVNHFIDDTLWNNPCSPVLTNAANLILRNMVYKDSTLGDSAHPIDYAQLKDFATTSANVHNIDGELVHGCSFTSTTAGEITAMRVFPIPAKLNNIGPNDPDVCLANRIIHRSVPNLYPGEQEGTTGSTFIQISQNCQNHDDQGQMQPSPAWLIETDNGDQDQPKAFARAFGKWLDGGTVNL